MAKSKTELIPADKPSLLSSLKQYSSTQIVMKSNSVKFVIDVGYLLYTLVYYKHGASFNDIAKACSKNLIQKYGKCTVVFDNYPGVPTKKDMAHQRRISRKSTEIDVSKNSILSVTREAFLGSLGNKKKFIDLLKCCFIMDGITVHQAVDDADTLIVKQAIHHAITVDTVVIGNDTDLVVLLWHMVEENGNKVFVQDEAKCWHINDLIKGEGLKEEILLIHAFLGCDQTSRLYRIPKDRVRKVPNLRLPSSETAKVFNAPSTTREEIETAGQRYHLQLLASEESSLNALRKKLFMQKVGRQLVKPGALPPTTDAANQHCARVYCQIQEWLGNILPPTDWGWRDVDSMLIYGYN